MSQENVELAYRALEAFNRRDPDAVLALAHEEVVVESRLVAMEGGYHGHEGVRRWWENVFDVLPDYEVEVEEVRDLGDVTLTRLRARAHGAESAAPLDEVICRSRDGVPGGTPVAQLPHGGRSPRSRRASGVGRCISLAPLTWARASERIALATALRPRIRRWIVYATVRRYEGVTDPTEAGRRVAEGFVPLIRDVPGFVAYYWVDAGNGVMISTSVFQDQAGAEDSNTRAADWVAQNLAELLPNAPEITEGEVVATS